MVKHVLFVRLADQSKESCEKLKEVFLSMKKEIPLIREMQVGIDFLHEARSYDVVLELTVDDRESLKAYQVHPYHAEVVKPYVHDHWREPTVVVDYEF